MIFMGTPAFAVPGLKAVINSNHSVEAVVTVADKRAGRSLKLSESPMKKTTMQYGLPVLQPLDLTDRAFVESLAGFNADVFVVVAFRILPPDVFNLPKHGAINLHASLLPDLRGAAPINWALMRGYKRTGLTTFQIAKQVDTGSIMLQEEIDIQPDDDAGSLSERMSELGARLIVKTLDRLAEDTLEPRLQQGESSKAPRLTSETCRIKWHWSAERLHNRVRGLSPSPCAFTLLNGKHLKIYRTVPHPDMNNKEPGAAHRTGDGRFFVSTGSGCLEILELQLEGKQRIKTDDFLRGRQIIDGTKLG